MKVVLIFLVSVLIEFTKQRVWANYCIGRHTSLISFVLCFIYSLKIWNFTAAHALNLICNQSHWFLRTKKWNYYITRSITPLCDWPWDIQKKFLWKEVCTDNILDSGNVRKTASLMSLKGSDISFHHIGKHFINQYAVLAKFVWSREPCFV